MTLIRFGDRKPFFTEDEIIKAYEKKEKAAAKAEKASAKQTA